MPSLFIVVSGCILLGGCKPAEPLAEASPLPPAERRTGSYNDVLEVCAAGDFNSWHTSPQSEFEDVKDADIIPISSKAYYAALKVLDGKAATKIEDTKPFGVDVGQRTGQPYLVRACLYVDFRKYFNLPKTTSLQRRLKTLKIYWASVQSEEKLVYTYSVMQKTNVASPAIYIVWSETDIKSVQGLVHSYH